MGKNSNDPVAKLPSHVLVAIFIFVVLNILPTLAFLNYGQDLFGENAFAKLLLVGGIGGALSSSIWAEGTKQRLVAILPGIVMGIGVPIAITSYVVLFNRTALLKVELVLPVMVGLFPGILLRLLIDLLFFTRNKR
jgi:hypothetical protein